LATVRKVFIALIVAGLLVPGSALAATKHRGEDPDRLSKQDREWMQSSAEGDLFEVMGGQIALTHSKNPAVRRYGHRLIVDHTKSYADMKKLGAEEHVGIPTSPSSFQQAVLGLFRSLRGHGFDCVYLNYEIGDHVGDILDTRDEVKQGTDKDVREQATTELPTLRMHLQLGVHLRAKVSC
jgi:putative membrane protein